MKMVLTQACILMAFYTVHAGMFVHAAQQKKQERPLLVVVLMVKNEACVIRQTLQPFVDAGVQHYFIFDTGSTDGTQQIVAEYFAENNIEHGCIEQEAFVDFATSRNRALELAEQRFTDAQFMILLDAEWYLCNAEKLVAFCHTHNRDEHDAFLIRIHTHDVATGRDIDFYLPRLVRPRAALRFVGKIHEYLDVTSAKKMPFEICFDVKQSELGAQATKKRLQRDLDLLLQSYSKDPEDARTIFFLAQTYVSLNNLVEAYHLFCLCVSQIVITKDTPCEQIEYAYQASYNAGVLAQELAQQESAEMQTRFSWQRAQQHYLHAFGITPCRAEPLMRIAQQYWDENNMHMCFIFARHAAELSYPAHATGLVESDVYTFRRYDLLGACAGNIGRWDVAEWAVSKALEAQPNKQHLRNNLAIILERRAAQRSERSEEINHYEL